MSSGGGQRVLASLSHDQVTSVDRSGPGGRVCAIVVTYNRPGLLRACLVALQGQTRPVDTLLVVDNASTDGTRAMLRADFPAAATVLALPTNVGGAGGFHAGMKWAYAQGYDWLWITDDDARPAPDCLERLLAHARPDAVLVPPMEDRDGHPHGVAVWRGRPVWADAATLGGTGAVRGDFLFPFVGPLIARGVVAQVGLPRRDFFVWFEDYEYSLRILDRTTAAIILVPEARVFHEFGGGSREIRFLWWRRLRSEQPPWKTYYAARNRYVLTRARRKPGELLLYFLDQLGRLGVDIAYGPERWERARLRLRGLRDGIVGRLGKRV
jgi:rhamnopyranosyl-N-acetylglucosaminyl-diphospho-decaprenol beta-1,3/1,4-galactofuranosyltransferase